MKKKGKKVKKYVEVGIAHIKASFNNTIVSISDMDGNILVSSSSGKMRFKGAQKSTAFAAQMVAENCARKAQTFGLKRIEVKVKGPGLGRDAAIRSLHLNHLDIISMQDVTPLPHNGCKPRKKRRV